MKDTTKALIEQHNDATNNFLARIERASDLFDDIDEYIAEGYDAGLQNAGLWECDHCGTPVEDPAHPSASEGCHLIGDGGFGTDVLCNECYTEAVAARAKIIVEIDEEHGDTEDCSALTEDELRLVSYLERNDESESRHARDIIHGYPRDERRTLHGYQDKIDWERKLRGKQVRK